MYFSDDSIIYEATYSGDERIGECLQRNKQDENAKKEIEDSNRKQHFQQIFEKMEDDVFRLPGLTFLKFTHLKIKFSFVPSAVRRYVSKKVIFYCSLKYYERYKIWNIRRDSFPITYKLRIARLFYTGDFFKIVDDLVLDSIFKIYEKLIQWTTREHIFRIEKAERYNQGEDVFLDDDDEELFLNEDDKRKLHEERETIWRRMLPPEGV